MLTRYLASLSSTVLLCSCQVVPDLPDRTCAIPIEELRTELPDERVAPESIPDPDTFQGTLQAMFRGAESLGGGPRNLLFLSGGSQNGAFGAGFLKGWAEKSGRLPEFEVVTGVSAGSILSTAAFIGDSQGAWDYFTGINAERDVLNAYARLKANGDPTLGSYWPIAKRGAVGDLKPMKQKLMAYLKGPPHGQTPLGTMPVIEQVRQLASTRHLFVAAVDTDSGQAVAFNLGKYLRDAAAIDEKMIECYADAVLASSSVPMAAPPTFIDRRMYIDGGARFGVFDEELIENLRQLGNRSGPRSRAANPPRVYMVMNGSQETQPDCKPFEEAKIGTGNEFCEDVVGEPTKSPPARPTWSLTALAKRSVSVLINQVYRFSVATIFREYERAYGRSDTFHFARMQNDLKDAKHQNLTCPEWLEADFKASRPLEFHPNYMKCLAEYGRKKALTSDF